MKCFQKNEKRTDNINVIYATYNIHHNSIDVYTYAGYFLRIDCNKAEEGLKTTPCSECALNALAIDEPLDIRNPSANRWIYYILREICKCGWMQKIHWNFCKLIKENLKGFPTFSFKIFLLKLYLIHSG